MVRYLLFGLEIALAWFCVLSVAGAVSFVAVRPLAGRWVERDDAPMLVLALRLLPAAGSLVGVIGLVMPAFGWLEPIGAAAAGERLGMAGASLACGGAALILLSLGRGVRAVMRTRRALRALAAGSTEVEHASSRVPIVVSDWPAPVLVLDGIARPRLFVSRSVMEALTPEELDRAVAHELSHHRSRDNVKRRLLAFAPDLVSHTVWARELEARWRHAAELRADADASDGSHAHPVALASALVKVARLSVGQSPLPIDRAAFHDGRPVADRVRRLLAVRAGTHASKWRARAGAVAAGAALLLLGATMPSSLSAVHRLTELLVHLP
jgi:Zn-dependent protease with chaperone function